MEEISASERATETGETGYLDREANKMVFYVTADNDYSSNIIVY
jgi:hypothetical protein